MKKLFLTLVAAMALAFSANAQFYVGGSFGLSVNSTKDHTSSSFYLNPEFGYDFNDKIAAGARVSLSGSPFAFSVDPYFRWKFTKVNSTKFFTDAMVSLGTADKNFMWGLSLQPGISFDITPRLSFVTRIAAIGVRGVENSTAFHLNLFNGASIGIFYHF